MASIFPSREHGLTFPPDYRDFVAGFGQLDILDREGRVWLQVFGLNNLSAARQDFRTLFAEWGCTDDWLEEDDEEREPLRMPYREMVPVIAGPDSAHYATACLGPDQLARVVSVKAWKSTSPQRSARHWPPLSNPPWSGCTATESSSGSSNSI